MPSLLPWLPRRAGSRAQEREEGAGREYLARQQAGERSGWQSGLAAGGDKASDWKNRVWNLEEKQEKGRGLAFIDHLCVLGPLPDALCRSMIFFDPHNTYHYSRFTPKLHDARRGY